MEFREEEWARKGATLSDKTARSEFGLAHVNRELKQLRTQFAALEERRDLFAHMLAPCLLGCDGTAR